jgi:hypothetical protein
MFEISYNRCLLNIKLEFEFLSLLSLLLLPHIHELQDLLAFSIDFCTFYTLDFFRELVLARRPPDVSPVAAARECRAAVAYHFSAACSSFDV